MSQRLLDGLNERQRDAVLTTEGPLLVLAGAGTGKTRVVTVRIAHLLAKGVAARNILAVTFTNKAAKEMHERVAALVGDKEAKALTTSTFHSFAVRMLRRFGHHLGFRDNFTIADEEDQQSLIRDCIRGLGISEKQLSPKNARFTIGDWKNRGLDVESAHAAACDEMEELSAMVYERLAEEMKRRNVVDFDDMILLSARLLDKYPEVRQECQDRFRYMLVDEYQDTNASQYGLVRSLTGARRNLCVVGDDDQSIYGWRGARARNILDFAKDYVGAKVVTLEQNYRSVNTILAAANSVIKNNPDRSDKKLWSALGEGEPITCYQAEDERDEEVYLGLRINELITRGTKHKDIAILVRANAHATAAEILLRQRKIPYQVVGTRSIFDRKEVRDLIAYIKVVANPRDDGALFRVINTPPRGIGKTTQDVLIDAAVKARKGVYELIRENLHVGILKDKAFESVEAFRKIMLALEADAARGVVPALQGLMERISYQAFINMEFPDGMDAQIRWSIVESLLKFATAVDARVIENRMSAFLEALALNMPKAEDKDADKGVWILTVHAAKGLEFDNVFIMAAEDDVFPHKNSVDEETGTDTTDEERRLFYVAITRARRRLTMTMTEQRTKWGRPEKKRRSRFIDEIDPKLLNFIDAKKQGPAGEEVAQDFLARLRSITEGKQQAL